MSNENQYNRLLGKALSSLTEAEASYVVEVLSAMESLLDEADYDDYFGTEGWKHRLGWE